MAALLDLWLLAFVCFYTSILICSSSPSITEEKKGNSKHLGIHKPLIFYCECFHVARVIGYQELIRQAIEAFEELLFSEEESKNNEKGKKREKIGLPNLSFGSSIWGL